MSATVELITAPGVYDIPAAVYHQDPVEGGSLSHSGARRLLEVPPARWRYEQRQPPQRSEAFDLGHAVHTLVLGSGPQLRLIEHDNYLTKAAKAERDQAYADGAVPMLPHEAAKARAMADAVMRHPAAALFDDGAPERVLVWRDERTGIWRRAMLDWLRPGEAGRRTLVGDLKTCHDASDDALAKSIADYGYHSQHPYYLDGIRALDLGGPDTGFVFVFVEKAPPHLVRVVELPDIAVLIGAGRNRRAIDIYAECTRTGEWPGYPAEIANISLPAWAEARQAQEYLQ